MDNIIKFPRKDPLLLVDHKTGKVTAYGVDYPKYTRQMFWETLLRLEEAVKDSRARHSKKRKELQDGHTV